MIKQLRPGLPALPARIAALPIDDRGYPAPWFVQWFHKDPDGTVKPSLLADQPGDFPDFRVSDSRKRVLAIKRRLCWVCGQPLGRYMAFVLGPMCAINQSSAEPPAHKDCAHFSAIGCPFLSKPQMVRRTNDLPVDGKLLDNSPGIALERNPGVTLVWITMSYFVFPVPAPEGIGAFMIRMGDPTDVFWFCQGREALREEVLESIKGGLPALLSAAEGDGPKAIHQLKSQLDQVISLLPREAA